MSWNNTIYNIYFCNDVSGIFKPFMGSIFCGGIYTQLYLENHLSYVS